MGNRKAVAVTAVALLAGMTAMAGWPGAAGRPAAPQVPAGPAGPAELVSYTGCGQLLSSLKAQALQQVGPYGLSGGLPGGAVKYSTAAQAAVPAAAPATGLGSAGATAGSPAGFSTTNDQVAGVDEPDVVKTNGSVMAVLRFDPVGIQTAAVGGLAPHLEGFLLLAGIGYPTGMFLTGGDAVILSQGPPSPAAGWSGGDGGPVTRVSVVSLADPAHPALTRSFDLTGVDAGARLIAGRVVVVVQHTPSLAFTYPSGPGAAAQASATAHNRAVIQSSTLADWLPTITSEPSGLTTTAGCADAWHSGSGTGMVTTTSVVTIDPAADQPGPATTVVGDFSTVYASADALYLAGISGIGGAVAQGPLPAGVDVPIRAGSSTDISEFDLSDPAHVRYVGSATVAGQLIGQYALDAYRGDLRVATTTGQATPAPGEGPTPTQLSESRITVLAPSAGVLTTVGALTGLGAGEKIYAVRFEGPLAYVVTFRQTDPLYVVDLSDPAHPAEKGQLALTGFSSFLQPLDPSLLLGVGQQVDAHLLQAGLQLSTFDVADPQAPALRSRVDLGQSYSPAQSDPHALLWWPARRLVALPLVSAGFAGVEVWKVGPAGTLHPVARLSQPEHSPSPPGPGQRPAVSSAPPASIGVMEPYNPASGPATREVVVGHLLYTVSGAGIMATDMDSWNQVAWLPFS